MKTVAEINRIKEPGASNRQVQADLVDWRSIIDDWAQSGLTQSAYCRQHTIKPHRLSYYKNKYQPTLKPSNQFMPVKLSSPSLVTETSLVNYQLTLPSGALLTIPPGYDKSSLQSLLNLLGVC